ncbi:hypothetical protein ACJX0J_029071, partial [Zea mays]
AAVCFFLWKILMTNESIIWFIKTSLFAISRRNYKYVIVRHYVPFDIAAYHYINRRKDYVYTLLFYTSQLLF